MGKYTIIIKKWNYKVRIWTIITNIVQKQKF